MKDFLKEAGSGGNQGGGIGVCHVQVAVCLFNESEKGCTVSNKHIIAIIALILQLQWDLWYKRQQ